MNDPDVLIVVDTSGSTAAFQRPVVRSIADLVESLGCETRIYRWSDSTEELSAAQLAEEQWCGKASFADLARILTRADVRDVVIYTDACLYDESEAVALRDAARQVAHRAARGMNTHVVLIGDTPDTAHAALLHSLPDMPRRLEQSLAVAAAIKGD